MFDFQTFRPWAKFWIPALVQLIVSGGTGSPGIHYFILDLVATILSWHTVAIPEVDACRNLPNTGAGRDSKVKSDTTE